MLQRALPAGFIAPCLPTKTDKLPSGSQWLHEIKRALAISVPASETRVLKHFQARMPYGLFVPDVAT